jgi:CheY-like chemotaxis protein
VQRGKRLDFRVIDTGPGIEKSLRNRVFEEFFQVPGSQTHVLPSANTGRGIGLGLAIASRLARLMDSQIRLHSHVGLGSVFAVEMPYRFALRPTNEKLDRAKASSESNFPPNTFIAVIDDDLEILRSTRMMLESHSVAVFTATTGNDAIRYLGQSGRIPDLIISDYRLGAEDGIQVIERLREEFNTQIPALLITGDTSTELVALFRSSGFLALYKPISGEQLVRGAAQVMRAGSLDD